MSFAPKVKKDKSAGGGGGGGGKILDIDKLRPGMSQIIITEIIPKKVFISNIEGSQNVPLLQSLGITHVVSILETRLVEFYPSTIQRLWVPVVDTASAVDGFEKQWQSALTFLTDCMQKGGASLIHCRAGMSRSSTILLAHCLDYHKMSLKDAWVNLYTKHPIAAPLTPFFNALIRYEQRLTRKPDGTSPPPSFTLMEYHLQMLHIIFPQCKDEEFLDVVRRCNGMWLTAARVYHQAHPNALNSFAMRYQNSASPFHPLCDYV